MVRAPRQRLVADEREDESEWVADVAVVPEADR